MQVYRDLQASSPRARRRPRRRGRRTGSTAMSMQAENYSVGRWLADARAARVDAQRDGARA